MAAIIIRKIDPETALALKALAKENGLSVESFLRKNINDLIAKNRKQAKTTALLDGLKRLRDMALAEGYVGDSTQVIRDFRNELPGGLRDSPHFQGEKFRGDDE